MRSLSTLEAPPLPPALTRKPPSRALPPKTRFQGLANRLMRIPLTKANRLPKSAGGRKGSWLDESATVPKDVTASGTESAWLYRPQIRNSGRRDGLMVRQAPGNTPSERTGFRKARSAARSLPTVLSHSRACWSRGNGLEGSNGFHHSGIPHRSNLPLKTVGRWTPTTGLYISCEILQYQLESPRAGCADQLDQSITPGDKIAAGMVDSFQMAMPMVLSSRRANAH
jgi:hypothetical protein